MEAQAKALVDLLAAISSMKAKLDNLHPVVLELNQCRPGVERAVDALRAEVGNLQADTTHRAEPVASIDMPPLLLSTDASSSSSKPASASRQISTDAAATSCIDHLDTSHVVPADAMLSAIVEEGLEPTADLRLGAEYDLDTSASTWTATASVATAVKASTASSATRSLACPISRTGISPFIPPSSCKDAQDVFESMSEPFGQSQDTTVTMKQQKDGQDSEVTLVVHPSNWYDQLLVSSVPCSVSMHIQIVFEKQRRVVTCELHSSWLLHAQANFSDWCSIGQLDIDDIVPIFPWNPGGYLSASINQMNLVFPATIRGSHWLVPSARDGPTGNSPFPVLGDEWLLPPWDFGQHADVSDDQFSWLMCELQLAQSGSHCLYLQEQQLYRSGIEGIVLNSLSININLCQLKWSASVLAYPGDMALYCSCFSSASEDISYESKMEHNNWVSCKVEQNTDVSTYGIKTALHSLCISVTTFRKRNRSVVYALLILFQYTALKYKGLWWSPTATLTKIMSTFSVGFPVQMDIICSVQPFLYVEETLVHKVLSGLLSVDEHQLSAGLNANHPTPGVIPRFSIAYAELRLPFSGAAINSALAVSLEDDIVVAFLNWYAGCTSFVCMIIQQTLLGLNRHTSLTSWGIIVSNTVSLQFWLALVLDSEVEHGPFFQHGQKGARIYPVLVALFIYIISANTEEHEAMEPMDTLVHWKILQRAEFDGSGNYSSDNMAIGTRHVSPSVHSVMSTMFCDAELSIMIIRQIGWPPRAHARLITMKLSSKGARSRPCLLCWYHGELVLFLLLAFDRQAAFQGVRCAEISITPYLALDKCIDYLDSLNSNVLEVLQVPWDPGVCNVSLSAGLRASRMLRRGECHGPSGLLHLVASAVGPKVHGQNKETILK